MGARKGQGRGEDAASRNRIEAAERRSRALDLRKAGATYDQIAQQLGFANRGNAQRAVQTALREITAEPAREVLTLELERLDTMLLGLWSDARRGKLGAVDRVLRIQERRARYQGLDHESLQADERHAAEVSTSADIAAQAQRSDTNPTDALLEEVQWTAGHVAWLRARIQESQAGDQGEGSGTDAVAAQVVLELYQRDRAHLLSACKTALAAGVEERRVKLAEQQGALLADVIKAILGDLHLTPEQAAVAPRIVSDRLRDLSMSLK